MRNSAGTMSDCSVGNSGNWSMPTGKGCIWARPGKWWWRRRRIKVLLLWWFARSTLYRLLTTGVIHTLKLWLVLRRVRAPLTPSAPASFRRSSFGLNFLHRTSGFSMVLLLIFFVIWCRCLRNFFALGMCFIIALLFQSPFFVIGKRHSAPVFLMQSIQLLLPVQREFAAQLCASNFVELIGIQRLIAEVDQIQEVDSKHKEIILSLIKSQRVQFEMSIDQQFLFLKLILEKLCQLIPSKGLATETSHGPVFGSLVSRIIKVSSNDCDP